MKATYYPFLDAPHLLNVVDGKPNKDGTVNLADDKGNVLVTSCPLSDEPKKGHAVLVKADKKSDEPPKKAAK